MTLMHVNLKSEYLSQFFAFIEPYLPLFYVFISGIGFSYQSLTVKLLELDGFYGSFQVVFSRGIAQVILASVVLCLDSDRRAGIGPKLCGDTKNVVIIMILRAVIGYGGIAFAFLAVERLPVGDGSVLVMLSPLFASILGYFILGEPWRLPEFIATILSLTGAALVAKPSFIFGSEVNEKLGTKALDIIGVIYALISSISAGFAFILVRILGTSAKMPWANICLVQGIAQLVLSIPFAYSFGQSFEFNLTFYQFLLLSSSGFIGSLSQVAMTVGMQREKSASATAMRMSDVVFSFIWQIAFTNDTAELLTVLGAVLVTSSILLIVFCKRTVPLVTTEGKEENNYNNNNNKVLEMVSTSVDIEETRNVLHALNNNDDDNSNYTVSTVSAGEGKRSPVVSISYTSVLMNGVPNVLKKFGYTTVLQSEDDVTCNDTSLQ